MPGLVGGNDGAAKRKRASPQYKPLKRVRSDSTEEDAQARILSLEDGILDSKKNYNNISVLLRYLHDGRDESVVAAIALCRVFTRISAAGDLDKRQETTEKEAVVRLWLRERYSEFKNALLQLLCRTDVGSTALTLCMRMLKSEGTHLQNGLEYNFPKAFLREAVEILLSPGTEASVRREFSEKYVEEYDDIRFFTFGAIGNIFKKGQEKSSSLSTDHAIEILAAIKSIPQSDEELENFYVPAPKKLTHALHSLTAHKKHAQKAWLALMGLEMNKDRRKKILGLITSTIAPWLTKPELLMDFLTDSYDSGGSTSLLALSGVFYLIEQRNLDYPSFYKKLYSLLDREALHSKHRSKFFRLLDIFLASTHLPAVLVASFIKRLSRLTLNAPPAAIVAVVPWIYNLLKRHPICTFMIHREVSGAEANEVLEYQGMEDPFCEEEIDPMETNAIDSCLWEIVMLQSHYHPNVATLAKIISEQFTKQAYNLEDFLDHSYGSMLEAELSKEVKKTPVVEYEIPKRIFTREDENSVIGDSLLVKLWDFG